MTIGWTSIIAAALAGAQQADEFEAALRAVPARARPVAEAPRPTTGAPAPARTRASAGPAAPARAGTLPPEWQRPPRDQDQLTLAERAGDRGLIDPVAWIERHVGGVPAVPGATPVRCRPSGLRAAYTLGTEGAPGFRRAIEDAAADHARDAAARAAVRAAGGRPRGHALPGPWIQFHHEAARLPANVARIGQAHDALRRLGYAPVKGSNGENWRPASLRPGALFVEIWFWASPMFEVTECVKRGVTMPTGPMFYATPAMYDPRIHASAGG